MKFSKYINSIFLSLRPCFAHTLSTDKKGERVSEGYTHAVNGHASNLHFYLYFLILRLYSPFSWVASFNVVTRLFLYQKRINIIKWYIKLKLRSILKMWFHGINFRLSHWIQTCKSWLVNRYLSQCFDNWIQKLLLPTFMPHVKEVSKFRISS